MVSLDEWLTLRAGKFFPFPTQWFATILSATEMTNANLVITTPFLFTAASACLIIRMRASGLAPYIAIYTHMQAIYSVHVLLN